MYSPELKRPSVKELFAAIRENGFSEVQLNMASVCGEQMPETIPEDLALDVCEQARANGIEIVAVNGTFNMIHPDASRRQAGLDRFEVVARACEPLRCGFVTLCTGSRDAQNMWRFHEDNDSQAAWDDLRDSMGKVLRIAERCRIILGVECEASNAVSSAGKARLLLDEFRSDRLKIIMDVANLFQPGQAKRENVRAIMDQAFDLLAGDITLAHGKDISEGAGLTFTHAGNGIVDFPYYLQKLKECGYRGGMLLHGVKAEEYFPSSVAFVEKAIREHWA
jgi:sugar phosphate isomerase/epimerase